MKALGWVVLLFDCVVLAALPLTWSSVFVGATMGFLLGVLIFVSDN